MCLVFPFYWIVFEKPNKISQTNEYWKATIYKAEEVLCVGPEDQWVNSKGMQKGSGVLKNSGLDDF